ncbi:restriction endonuclease [Streptomyces sp. NPDC058297]|uniref:restriction endonuclease n=1 Tax=Streptomyces sp. NPDC058297 TaxID=3346433 RepID=UPI0036E718CC
MSRRSAGYVNTWAEAQRAYQRQIEAEQRRRREEARLARDYQRRAAQGHREYRHAEARRRTEELDAQIATLQGLLTEGCQASAFRATSLMRVEDIPPFDPGQLAWPVRMPNQGQYQAQGGWTANRRAQAEAEARARFEHDWHQAQTAEAQRQQQLAAFQRDYEQWAEAQRAEIRRHNEGITEVTEGVRQGDPELVVEYFSAALYASTAWPEGFPRQLAAAFDPAARQLVLNWELPGYDVVPETKSVRYVPAQDQDKETARPVTQRRALYREVLAQSVLLVLHQLFAADEYRILDSVALNGFVDAPDPATGRQTQIFLATVMAQRAAFTELHLEQVDATSCLTEALRGQLTIRPDQLSPVRPSRQPEEVRNQAVSHGGGGEEQEPDLYEMDPIAFESLVADLFRAMGMQAVTTQRSNDGGVDVDALDPAPIRGGKIVVQVKRYRNTVPLTAVRDLYGTVQDAGANKGVLVTTSKFGPGSHTFARGKPLELIEGSQLVDLLHRHGLRGRLGESGRPAPAPPEPSGPATSSDDYNVLGMTWSGDVALDVCALVCTGNRVLSEDHFVCFNNPQTPDGSVRALPAYAPDKAAIRVSFDALSQGADRFVLVAAVDPETNPDADLSGFTDACIRLLDPSMSDLGRLEVSDGRARETALVLGSFRRRSSGDWDFVLGGKGYTGGLEELVQDYGIEVE